jgi:hypothetical protein
MSVAKLVTLLAGGAILASVASCGSGELPIAGKVLVDGAPMESGTVRFDPVDAAKRNGAGGKVEAADFQLPAGHGLVPGRYRVSATAFKKTGKTINDYQRGAVEEMVQLPLVDSPKEIELSHDDSANLTVEFMTAAQR